MGKRFGYLLILAILAIEIPRFYEAYQSVDSLWLAAVATGFVLPLGSMYIFHTWWTSKRNARNWLLVAFGLNLALAGATLVPWGMAQLRAIPLAQVVTGWWAWGWIAVVVLSPFVLTAGITTAMAFQKEERRKPKREVTEHQEKTETIEEPEQVSVPDLPPLDRELLELWTVNPQLSQAGAAREIGKGKSVVHRRVVALEADGLLERTGNGIVVDWNGNGREP